MKLIILSRKKISFRSSSDFPKKADGLFLSNEEFMGRLLKKAEELGVTTSSMKYLIDESLQFQKSKFIATIPVEKLRKVNGIVLICANSIDEVEEYVNVFKQPCSNWRDDIRYKNIEELKLPFSNKIESNFKRYKMCMLSTYKFSKKALLYLDDDYITTIELKEAPRYLVRTIKNELYWLDEGMNEDERENLIVRWEKYKD